MSRRERIREHLQSALSPLHLEVTDESYRHRVPAESESHFKVVVVSDRFAEQTLVTRQRWVNKALQGEFESGLHALALSTWTPEEWFEKGGVSPDSPHAWAAPSPAKQGPETTRGAGDAGNAPLPAHLTAKAQRAG